MKSILALLFVLTVASSADAQAIEFPKESLKLKNKQTGGTNGTAVAFNAKTNLYHTAIAGNAVFPLETFNSSGINVHDTETGSDMRGLWWNKKTKSLEGNCYNDGGIVELKLDGNGHPTVGNSIIHDGRNQPTENSVGAFDGKKKIYYYNEGKIYTYDRKTGKMIDSKALSVSNSLLRNCNVTTVIYTGKKKMELGLLDYVDNKVLLIDLKTLQITKTITLPSNAVTHDMFRFSYANNRVFLYNTSSREWTGYQIFED